MVSQTTTTPKIESTTAYGMFKLLGGNRPIDYNHVKRIKRSMERYPHMFASNPIEVNENMFIIDGQHRRLAAQELGVPVYYIVVPGATLEETRIENITQRRWSLMDFANSYAESGRPDYRVFLKYVKMYPKIAPGILRVYLAGGQKHQLETDFRNGEFHVEDEQHAAENLKKLAAVVDKTNISLNAPMAHGLLALFEGKVAKNSDPFDYDFFMQKLERETARELLRPANSIRACMRSIEDVYNFQSKQQKRLY